MKILRYLTNTAIVLGPFLSNADGSTPITGLSAADFSISTVKESDVGPLSSSSLSLSNSGGVNDIVEISSGYYSLELTSGDSNTYGRFDVFAAGLNCLPVWDSFQITTTNFFDSMYGTSNLSADYYQIVATGVGVDELASAVASASSAAIVSGIGEWGDLRWSKIYGIPLEQWDVVVKKRL